LGIYNGVQVLTFNRSANALFFNKINLHTNASTNDSLAGVLGGWNIDIYTPGTYSPALRYYASYNQNIVVNPLPTTVYDQSTGLNRSIVGCHMGLTFRFDDQNQPRTFYSQNGSSPGCLWDVEMIF
jgi:hypothetical protein